MKIKALLIMLICPLMYFGQPKSPKWEDVILKSPIVSNAKAISTITEFASVADSISKLMNPKNSIIIKTNCWWREFYLTKDSLHWKGYFIKNLVYDERRPITLITDSLGREHVFKPLATTIITFDADSLYKKINNKSLYSIKQVPEKLIEKLHCKREMAKNRNDLCSTLPQSSHESVMVIIINRESVKSVSYREGLYHNRDLYFISTLRTFSAIYGFLVDTFEGCYY